MGKSIQYFKQISTFLLLLFFLFYNTKSAHAQWVQSAGPYAGYIADLVKTTSNDIYAGSYTGGVFKLPSGSSNWISVNNGITNSTVSSLAVLGSGVFAGTLGGVFVSTNGGSSWTSVNSGITDLQVLTLAVSGTNIYAGTYSGKIFFTSNFGSTWNNITNGLPSNPINTIYGNGSTLFVGFDVQGMYFSSNNGSNWNKIDTGLFGSSLYINHILYSGTTGLYYIASHNGVYKTTNSGLLWTSTGLSGQNVSNLTLNGTNIFACTEGNGVYLSTNSGTSWTNVNTGLNKLVTKPLLVFGTNLLLGTFGKGIYLSNNNGGYWITYNNGLYNASIYSLYYRSGILLTGSYASGLYRSSNFGATWDTTQTILSTNFNCITDNNTTMFCGTSDYGVMKSVNGGLSWTSAGNSGLTNLYVNTIAANSSYLFAGTQGSGVFRSTNIGATFVSVSSTLPSNSNVRKLTLIGTSLYAALKYNGIYKTTNYGDSWIPANTGIPVSNMNITTITGSGSFLAAAGVGVYVSTNGGSQWITDTAGLPQSTYFQTLIIIGNSIYVGTSNAGIYRQTYNGITFSNWTPFNTGISAAADIRDLLYASPNLYAGLWGLGVWKTSITDVINTSTNIPDKYSLYQNYPNPFNPVTTINFDIPKSALVKITIFDITGKEINNLINDNLSPGSYSIQWDGANVASGIYFYKITSGDFSEIRKMVLIK